MNSILHVALNILTLEGGGLLYKFKLPPKLTVVSKNIH